MQHHIVAIGGGPGGYVAAVRAARREARVSLVEGESVGGTRLNRGVHPLEDSQGKVITVTPVDTTNAALRALTRHACQSGATAAAVIDADGIVLRDDLAALCNADQCDHYGQAPSCPPYVGGPEDFKKRFGDFSRAVVIRIDVPTDILLSSQRREVMRLLHEVAAGVERAAAAMGWPGAAALAGGSCRHLFCFDDADCAVVNGGGDCRYPDSARPSMSGFGIDVTRLMAAAGWSLNRAGEDDAPTAPVVALVLLNP